MNKEQLEWIKGAGTSPKFVTAMDLDHARERTLIYGYQCNRDTFHVYMEGGQLHRLVHRGEEVVEYAACEWFSLSELVPDKRIYPENMDYELAKILALAEVRVDYTTFDEGRYKAVQEHPGTYWGETYESLAS